MSPVDSFAEVLRSDLESAALLSDAGLGVSAESVADRGRSRVLRRRVAFAAGGLTAATALVVTVVIGTHATGRDDSRPGRTTSVTTTQAPEPLGTATIEPQDPGRPLKELLVTYDPVGRVATVDLVPAAADGERVQVRVPLLPGMDGGYVLTRAVPGHHGILMVSSGIRPVPFPDAVEDRGAWRASGDIAGAPLHFQARFTPGPAPKVDGIWWLDGTGAIFSDGSTTSVACADAPCVWLNRAHAWWGSSDRGSGSHGPLPDPVPTAFLKETILTSGDVDASGRAVFDAQAVAVLPPGARDVRLRLDKATKDVGLASAPFEDGTGLAVFLTRRVALPQSGSDDVWRGVVGVQWADASGTIHLTRFL